LAVCLMILSLPLTMHSPTMNLPNILFWH
jgi:hypothetical protein